MSGTIASTRGSVLSWSRCADVISAAKPFSTFPKRAPIEAPSWARAFPITVVTPADGSSWTIHRVFGWTPALAPYTDVAPANVTSRTATATALYTDIAAPECSATTLARSLHFRTRRDFVTASLGGERIMNVRRRLLVGFAALVTAVLAAAPATTLADAPVISSFSVTGSPFAESFAP